MSPRNSLIPTLALLYGATFWGFVWYPLRLIESAGLTGPWQLLVSYLCATLAFLPFAQLHGGAIRDHLGSLTWLAFASGWTNVAFVLAMLDGTVVRVLLLFYLSPIWQTVFAWWLLGERVGKRTLGVLLIGVSGALVMLWEPRLGVLWLAEDSDWLALSSGFAFALTNVMARRLQGVNVGTKTLFAWLGVVSIALVVLAVQGSQWPQLPLAPWAGAATLGLFGFLFSTLLVVYGVTHMPAQRSAIILLFEVVVGALTAWWLAGEYLGWREWLGGALIVIAGVVAAMRERPVPSSTPTT